MRCYALRRPPHPWPDPCTRGDLSRHMSPRHCVKHTNSSSTQTLCSPSSLRFSRPDGGRLSPSYADFRWRQGTETNPLTPTRGVARFIPRATSSPAATELLSAVLATQPLLVFLVVSNQWLGSLSLGPAHSAHSQVPVAVLIPAKVHKYRRLAAVAHARGSIAPRSSGRSSHCPRQRPQPFRCFSWQSRCGMQSIASHRVQKGRTPR